MSDDARLLTKEQLQLIAACLTERRSDENATFSERFFWGRTSQLLDHVKALEEQLQAARHTIALLQNQPALRGLLQGLQDIQAGRIHHWPDIDKPPDPLSPGRRLEIADKLKAIRALDARELERMEADLRGAR